VRGNLLVMITCPFCKSSSIQPLYGDWLRCRACGLGFKEKLYSPENLAPSAEERPAVWKDSQQPILMQGLRTLEQARGTGGKILDIGCGHGYFLSLARERGWRCEGVEISSVAARHAREKFKLTVYDEPLEKLSLAPGTYDAATLWRVLDLLPEPHLELERIHRLLAPGGMLVIRVNNFLFHRYAFMLNRIPILKRLKVQPGVIHRYGITPRALKKVLARTGFEVLSLKNSTLTTGDPYASGGRFGALFVVAAKRLLYYFWQAVAMASAGKLLLGSSIIAVARKPDNRKTIVQVITRLDTGGSTESAISICRNLSNDKYNFVLITGRTSDSVPACRFPVVFVDCLVRNISPINDLRAVFSLYRIFRRLRPHIVHTHSSKAGIIGRWAAWLAGVPNILHMPHGHVFYGYDFSRFMTQLYVIAERLTAGVTTRFIAITEGERAETLARKIGTPAQWDIVHSGVTTGRMNYSSWRSQVRNGRAISDDTIVIGTVARLEPVKGIEYFIDAATILANRLAKKHKLLFVIVGDGTLRARLERRITANGMGGAIELLGTRDDVPQLMSAMDIYVQPSLNEGMGKTLVQASDAGLSVVATRVQGIPDVIIEGKTGLLVPARDASALAEAIRALIEDPSMRMEMGAAGKQWVNETASDGYPRFSHERMIHLLEKLYER